MKKILVLILALAMALTMAAVFTGCGNNNGYEDHQHDHGHGHGHDHPGFIHGAGNPCYDTGCSWPNHPAPGDARNCHCHGRCTIDGCLCHGNHHH
ncbi:MAG: hypothetical protein FWB76_04140 [Oscillospiraceae bacterium]|nr:hypothetical protein [Oscillospiraceae bacterium]